MTKCNCCKGTGRIEYTATQLDLMTAYLAVMERKLKREGSGSK